MLNGVRIFLAGATGAIGRRLLPLLISGGHSVTAMVRSPEGALSVERDGATAVQADAMDAAAVRAAVLAARPEVLMHQLTALSGGDFAANSALRVHGTRNLADAAEAAGVSRFIAQSINWVYEPGDVPATESVPLNLRAKSGPVPAVAELEAQTARSPEWVVLRYGSLYGPGTWYSPDGAFGQQAREGKLTATADVASFVHVDDAATAAVAALDWPSGAVNVCDEEPAAGLVWLPAFCAAAGAAPPPPSDAPRSATARGADSTLARTELGWTPRWASWRAGFPAMPR
jgi:nucleoside-diphosphate-sugar epimerase